MDADTLQDVQAYAQRLAEQSGHEITVAEIMAETARIRSSIGLPYTMERMIALVAEESGIPAAQIAAKADAMR